MLELRNVRKHYRGPHDETIRAVDGVSITVAAGELHALYGPSGSGKSTLLMLAAGLAHPDAGEVRFDGRDVGTLSRREAARYRLDELGFVFQSFNLVPGLPAIDNAALKLVTAGASRRDARRQVAPLLERLGMIDRAEQRPGALSRGERQRVAIARALAGRPRLLLADEPTGSLDSSQGRDVLALLAEICRERSVGVLLATHDPAGAEHADRVHRLRDGRLVASTSGAATDPGMEIPPASHDAPAQR